MVFLRLLFFIFSCCCLITVRAQSPVIDSLTHRIKQAQSNMEEAELQYLLGDELSAFDTARAITYIRQGLSLAGEDSFYKGMGYFYLGRICMEFSRVRAAAAFDTAILYLQQHPYPQSCILQSRSWANKAVIAQLSGDNKTYVDIFLNKAIPLAAKGGDSLRVADGYTNIALPFMNYEEYDKAIDYLNRAVSIFERLAPKDLRVIDNYTTLAKIYLLRDSIILAGKNLEKARPVLKEAPSSQYAPNYHMVEGMYFIKQEKWKEAGITLNQGLAVAEKIKSRYDIRQLLYQKARLADMQGDWKTSKRILLKMYHEGYVELVTDKKQLFGDLARLESHLGNYRAAFEWMVRHAAMADTFYAQQTKAQIADMEARYNYAQKEKELLEAREKSAMQRNIIRLTLIAALIALVAVYFWYRSRKIRTIQNLKQQQRIALGQALLEGEERERARMARDLHDGLGGMLAGIRLNLSQMMDHKSFMVKKDLEQTLERLGNSVDELRRISRNMMPESLVRSDLQTALKDLCEEATLPRLKVTFNAFDIPRNYTPQAQLIIYRIVQELVHNAVKHAGASKIMVQCSHAEHTFFITVEDNGKGFAPGDVSSSGYGLKNIQSRVSFLNGSMHIESTTEGTIANIELYAEQS